VVRADILLNTHRGAANTMGDVLNMGKQLSRHMDGDIVFAFNQAKVDSNLQISSLPNTPNTQTPKHAIEKKGRYISASNYFYVKRAGSAPPSVNELSKEIRNKVASYVPKGVEWGTD
jgi:hypothetical protein